MAKSKILVIGAGMVGTTMALDMSENHLVTVADFSIEALKRIRIKNDNISTSSLDCKDEDKVIALCKLHDLIIIAVPGYLGFNTLKYAIKSGRNIVDISFFSEDALELDSLAKEYGVTVITDCGVAPGMGNLILGCYDTKLTISDFDCVVGGLPKIKKWPFYYKAPFSPIDVIEEYTRPARYVENGKIIVKEAMSDVEHIEFSEVGTLEAFNSDGLRSILYTMSHIPNMKEKTLRFPGHIEQIKALKQSGFFATDEIECNGQKIRPLDFSAKVLFKEWKLEEHEEEFTIMRIKIKGTDGKSIEKNITYHLYDEYCAKTNCSSMSRTTGYTATAAAHLILNGLYNEIGVFPPELVGRKQGCLDFVLKYLAQRGVNYRIEEN